MRLDSASKLRSQKDIRILRWVTHVNQDTPTIIRSVEEVVDMTTTVLCVIVCLFILYITGHHYHVILIIVFIVVI